MTKMPKTLTTEEQTKLIDALPNRRNQLMACLMLDAGLRVGEVVHLLQTDLVISDKPVTVLRLSKEDTKNKRERMIPLSVRIRHLIEVMHDFVWNHFDYDPANYAFYIYGPEKPITTRQVQRIIKSASLSALGRSIHPHMLRHTFATRLMQSSNIRVVQELLGHRDIRSTQIYTHPNHEDLTKAIAKLET